MRIVVWRSDPHFDQFCGDSWSLPTPQSPEMRQNDQQTEKRKREARSRNVNPSAPFFGPFQPLYPQPRSRLSALPDAMSINLNALSKNDCLNALIARISDPFQAHDA